MSEQEQLELANQQKLNFFTNISHEIKTPLTLIYSPLKYLLNKDTSDIEIRKALPSLYRNAKRMISLIDQLLQFRKAEMSTLRLNIASVDCIEVCNEIIDYFNYFSKIEGIRIILKSDFENELVELDRDKFTKIMFNLISNALKYSNPGDTVNIDISLADNFMKINVKDHGCGIPQDELSNIFKRYYQIENSVAGTGIGLALTKHLIDLHDGSIAVESEVGTGTLFKIQLPIKQSSTTHKESQQNEPDESPLITSTIDPSPDITTNASKNIKLLIVDDEWELRHFLKQEFSKDYNVVLANNGKDGFSTAIKEMPDLIISDVMMPESDGFTLCNKIKNDIRISHTPVILLTAKSMFADHAEGLNSGADLYLPKPFDLELLKLQISSLLRNRQILKRRFESDPELKTTELTQNDTDKAFLDKAIQIVFNNMENQEFKVSEFVKEMGMSRTLVYHKINAIAGKPVKDFILNLRLQKAAKLLTNTEKSISEIAYACGFGDPSYFSTVFKRYYSQSPQSYRNNYLVESLKSL